VAVAWLREIEERDRDGNALCTGRFECEGEELPFRDAVAWTRARADRAYIDIEFERYILIGEDGETPPLPPALAERVSRGLRRPEGDAWRDRADDAEPIRWVIVATLSVPDLKLESRPQQEQAVERVAGRLRAAGCEEVAWSSDELDAGLSDIDAQGRRAGKSGGFAWFTTHALAFVLTASAEARTYRPLLERARAVVLDELDAADGRRPYERGAEDISDRWGVDVDVHPPGYEWRPPAL
jgi:hypothetical protein